MSIFCVKLHIHVHIYIFSSKLIIKEKHVFDLSGGWPFSGMGIVWETYFNKGVPCPWGSLKILLNQGDKPWIFGDPRRFRCHFGRDTEASMCKQQLGVWFAVLGRYAPPGTRKPTYSKQLLYIHRLFHPCWAYQGTLKLGRLAWVEFHYVDAL